MKTRDFFLAVVSWAVVTAGCGAQTLPTPQPSPTAGGVGPKIKFANTVHDFGRISGGDITKCDFVFTNVGDKTLEITDVRPGCGCTTAGAWTRQVEPGKTGTIPLQFNSANFHGAVTKTATVTCNDPSQHICHPHIEGKYLARHRRHPAIRDPQSHHRIALQRDCGAGRQQHRYPTDTFNA